MISLDEAIIHCEEKAKELREDVERHAFVDAEDICDCIECAEEHEQLAAWLKELKEYQALFDSPKEAEDLLNQFMV